MLVTMRASRGTPLPPPAGLPYGRPCVSASPTSTRLDRRSSAPRRGAVVRWAVTAAATITSALALDAAASAVGVLLVATGVLARAPFAVMLPVLATTYALWALGLRASVMANGRLLDATGTSTNALSKLLFDAARRRAWSPAGARRAAATGYVAVEAAKEIPYYVGAFGAALLADSVETAEAIVFLAGTNLGAAGYELGLARLTRRGLAWRSRRASRLRVSSTPAGTAA